MTTKITSQSSYNNYFYEMCREHERDIEREKSMESLKFCKVGDVKTPVRAHETDAGIDFFVPNDFKTVLLEPGDDVCIDSKIKVIVPRGYALIFKEKSGIALNRKLTVGAAVVDSDYRGVVHFHLFNNGKINQTIEAGDKIIQGLVVPISLCDVEEIEEEDYNLCVTERSDGGFGSSGVK